jgi:hypothetical protein
MLSVRFNTIFVHVPKTAGQSIERVFLAQHGLDWDNRAALLLCANRDPARGPARLAHLYAREYVSCGHVSETDFSRHFKFAVVRNPYARLVSQFRFRYQDKLDFRAFVERLGAGEYDDRTRHMASQANFVLGDDGALAVDEILRFEELPAAFAPVSRRVFGFEQPLPHVNRSRGLDPTDSFDNNLRRIVFRRYERDFDLFRYPSGL